MFDSSAHAGDDAELYALGQLGEADCLRIEGHLQHCTECARRVGDAEATVLRLIEADANEVPASSLPARLRSGAFAWRWIAAVAAAFVVGLLPWIGNEVRRAPVAPADQQVVMTALLHSHFLHAPFVASVAGVPAAKVIYGRGGGWLYVLAAAGQKPLQIAVEQGAKQTVVATLPAGESTRAAYVALATRADAVLLLEDGRAVARANVDFARAERH
jgi:hypothetical protein